MNSPLKQKHRNAIFWMVFRDGRRFFKTLVRPARSGLGRLVEALLDECMIEVMNVPDAQLFPGKGKRKGGGFDDSSDSKDDAAPPAKKAKKDKAKKAAPQPGHGKVANYHPKIAKEWEALVKHNNGEAPKLLNVLPTV